MTEKGEKRKKTIMDKLGITEEEYYKLHHNWSSKGGKNSPGFRNMTAEQRSEAGRKGGSVPRMTHEV